MFNLDWHGIFAPSVPLIQRFYHPPPLLLVKNGRLLHKNMRQELSAEDELMTHLRRVGMDELANVAEAHMEGDGSICEFI